MNRGRRRQAFSLIELMVVIGLIALLSVLLIIGIGHMLTNSKRQQTQLAFQNVQAMFAEYDSVNHSHFSTNPSPVFPCPNIVTPADNASSAAMTDRTNFDVLMTRGMISQLKTFPVTATALGKMSAAAYTTVSFDLTSAQLYATSSYVPGQVVYTQASDTLGNPINYYFACIRDNGGTPSVGTTDKSYWIPLGSRSTVPPMPNNDSTDALVPILTDGWGNPIIFVPGVLGYGPGSTSTVNSNKGMLTAGGTQGVPIRSPDGRPFWASAGPDGDFSKGDDNMYSYEK